MAAREKIRDRQAVRDDLKRPANQEPSHFERRGPAIQQDGIAILNAIRYTRGDRNLAAVLLGIGRTTLYRKLREYEQAGYADRSRAAGSEQREE